MLAGIVLSRLSVDTLDTESCSDTDPFQWAIDYLSHPLEIESTNRKPARTPDTSHHELSSERKYKINTAVRRFGI